MVLARFFLNNKLYVVSEIASVPFHFALILNADELCDEDFYGLGTDITELINYKYDEELNVALTLNIRELNTIIPFDFRTKKQVEEAWSVKE